MPNRDNFHEIWREIKWPGMAAIACLAVYKGLAEIGKGVGNIGTGIDSGLRNVGSSTIDKYAKYEVAISATDN